MSRPRPGWSRGCADHCREADAPGIWTIFDDTHLGLDRPHALDADEIMERLSAVR
ncbi:hypothetical protein [Spirillospora sp. NPDC047279]|uniref:hypothetical protein n=1 Tax=Spirillospora sp. NPDC047279 TaxID=3155478 RepID=UPI00340D24EF